MRAQVAQEVTTRDDTAAQAAAGDHRGRAGPGVERGHLPHDVTARSYREQSLATVIQATRDLDAPGRDHDHEGGVIVLRDDATPCLIYRGSSEPEQGFAAQRRKHP